MNKKRIENEIVRKTIEIEKDTWEFIGFLRKEKKYSSLKEYIEIVLSDLKTNNAELYKLFLEKKKLELKIKSKLNDN